MDDRMKRKNDKMKILKDGTIEKWNEMIKKSNEIMKKMKQKRNRTVEKEKYEREWTD